MPSLALVLASCAVPVEDLASAPTVRTTDQAAARHGRDEADLVVEGTGLVGQSIAVLDADVDGNADLVIGASMAHRTGEVYVVFGPDAGTVDDDHPRDAKQPWVPRGCRRLR